MSYNTADNSIQVIFKGILRDAGIEVIEVSDAVSAEMPGHQGEATLSTAKKRALDTFNSGSARKSKKTGYGSENHQGSVVKFDDNANLQNNLDNLANKYNGSDNLRYLKDGQDHVWMDGGR